MPLEYPITQDFDIKWRGSIAIVELDDECPRVCLLDKLISGKLYVRTLVGPEWFAEALVGDIKLRELHTNSSFFPTGYFDTGRGCIYKARSPIKQYRKGITEFNIEFHPLGVDLGPRDVMSPSILRSMLEPVKYEYTLKELITILVNSNNPPISARSLSSNFALLNIRTGLTIYFRGIYVGRVSRGGKITSQSRIRTDILENYLMESN